MGKYNFSNKDDIELYARDNIDLYNTNIRLFTYKNYLAHYLKELKYDQEKAKKEVATIPTSTHIGPYLSQKLNEIVEDEKAREKLDKRLLEIDKSKDIEEELKKIAVEFGVYKKDLNAYFRFSILKKLSFLYFEKNSKYRKELLNVMNSYNSFDKQILSDVECEFVDKYIAKSFDVLIKIMLSGGFVKDFSTVNTGTKRSEEGDAAQFMFLARAILAGFSCSNVDVRTSPYDAVIDYETYLLRIQIKGIKTGGAISFKTSPRGGAGNDTSAPTNAQRPITSKDCDIYVAVDKNNGLCYIIPIDDIEKMALNNKFSLGVKDRVEYEERWDLIEKKAKSRFDL